MFQKFFVLINRIATDTNLAGYPAAGYPPYIFAGYPAK